MASTHGLAARKQSHLTVTRIRGGGPASATGLGILLPSQVVPAGSPVRDGVPGAGSSAVRRSPVSAPEAARRPSLLATPQLDERGRAQLTLVGRILGWQAGRQAGRQAGGAVTATADADADAGVGRVDGRLSAPWPTGYHPFSGPEFQALADLG